MRQTLRDFLVDLAVDPDLLQQFVQDRRSAIERWSQGLTAQEKEALLSGDADRIRSALGGGKGIIPVYAKTLSARFTKRKGTKKSAPKKTPGRRPRGTKR
jgi:hypothetical protein